MPPCWRWSAYSGAPLKSELDRSWSTQRAEQQLTHPEVVEEFRRLAGLSSDVLRTTGICDHVVIAVDELDKIGQPDNAHTFINDIKGIFGVPGCLFLMSVSNDAITTFERHGIAVRNAVDSAFTEIVTIDSFALDKSRRWLTHHLRNLAETTVKTHVGTLFTKLGARDRAAAIVFAFDSGLVQPRP